jgi:hypothetical protein
MNKARGGDGNRALSEPAAIAISAAVGLAVAFGSTYFFSTWADMFYEQLFRVGPTTAFDGIGSDWFVGNTEPWLNFLISLLHAADVLMGVFILLMVFIHWGAFRRLAGRMQDPAYVGEHGEEAYTDGGTGTDEGGADAGDGERSSRSADAADVDPATRDEDRDENEEVPR